MEAGSLEGRTTQPGQWAFGEHPKERGPDQREGTEYPAEQRRPDRRGNTADGRQVVDVQGCTDLPQDERGEGSEDDRGEDSSHRRVTGPDPIAGTENRRPESDAVCQRTDQYGQREESGNEYRGWEPEQSEDRIEKHRGFGDDPGRQQDCEDGQDGFGYSSFG